MKNNEIYLSTGNKKLKNNENTRFLIWNIPACKTCPFATEHCKKFCYAKKAERVYPNVLPCRENNFEMSLQADFVEKMIAAIEKKLKSKAHAGKLTLFRIHESGDFYNLEYTKKWVDICKHFENDDRIIFLAYTKSLPYFEKLGYNTTDFPKNFVVRSSVWDDTKEKMLKLTKALEMPIYTAYTPNDLEKQKAADKTFVFCDCVDCGKCKACYFNQYKNIGCLIH
jgi:hypothetical protein